MTYSSTPMAALSLLVDLFSPNILDICVIRSVFFYFLSFFPGIGQLNDCFFFKVWCIHLFVSGLFVILASIVVAISLIICLCHLIVLPVLHCMFSVHPPVIPFLSLCTVVLLSLVPSHNLLQMCSYLCICQSYLLYDVNDSLKERMNVFLLVLPLCFGVVCCYFSFLASLHPSIHSWIQ